MNNDLELWEQILSAFSYKLKTTDKSPQSKLDRVAGECLDKEGFSKKIKSFNMNNCSVSKKKLPDESLKELIICHDKSDPEFDSDTIIVLLYGDKRIVIDGNNRLNKRLKENSKTPFFGILIEPYEKIA